jgi:hypothetical protein
MHAVKGLLIASALVASGGLPAAAQTAEKPVPGCAGAAFLDGAGDQIFDPTFLGAPVGPGPESGDILRGWFLTDPAGQTTANIEIANLNTEIPAYAQPGGHWYYMLFRRGDLDRFVRAAIQPQGVTYAHGFLDFEGVFLLPAYNTQGPTTGRLFQGPNGVVQIDIPSDVAPAGSPLDRPVAEAHFIQGKDDFYGQHRYYDWAPDEGVGRTYTVQPCAAG